MSNASTSGKSAVFLTGSTMRHVIIMTTTSAIGLMSIFFVDAITLFYISQLEDPSQTAAVGRASYVIAFIIGMSVGFMIGTSAMVARALGAGQDEAAKSYAGTSVISVAIFGFLIAALGFLLTDWLMDLLGATGEALDYARTYLFIVLPSTPFFAIGIVTMGILRAHGDAKRSMYITLIGGFLTAVLDPIFIFVFGWEVIGAAIVSAIVRVSFAALGLYYLIGIHKAITLPDLSRFFKDLGDILKIAAPTVVTNLAAPVGAFLIARAVADYGDAAVAGQSVVDRLIPLAFGVIFALSGAVGPIIGQNYGALQMGRVRQALIDGLIFNAVYVLVAWALLFIAQNQIIAIYQAEGNMALVIRLFCTVLAGSFLFNGMLFVSNAAYNNLGYPLLATLSNWARHTIGVLPFIYVGGLWGGLPGIIWGAAIGAIFFGILPVVGAFWLIDRLTPDAKDPATTADTAEAAEAPAS
ncbi:MATE family efflux transporter [Maritalea mediterranea]|uniref:MATE family efflux transporter n=1 Tax=Maritalea mediterranea TaxID=2909667 RepID=A0ABS9E6F0_9HYPH|nr:MATE family efflux transporter [Maritalea mediterranea]MCF4097792.1 MATE family efflux transporter [Maritalea mediterranea]